ncbi:hypothetical protein M758_8G085600 [Ceratodon purpureus]|uniref:Uncharacterized protein n=1 Tax=Ceratodon purpureus TaxID=3225 RepID=A0A8T0GYP5_CERPU|nr:hypothetical protein KC19_8G089800 [Ceratodon purpureus]KAG0608186.1 hypothetical protein M758_8G085600 [Ceratodon purpureus]
MLCNGSFMLVWHAKMLVSMSLVASDSAKFIKALTTDVILLTFYE